MNKGFVYVLITTVLFVTLEPVSKLISWDVNPYAITFWRFIIGSLILLPFAVAKIKKEKICIGIKDVSIMTLLGTLFICVSMVLLQIGVKKAESPSLIAIVFSANSIFTILFAVMILKEKPTKNKIIALVFGLAGVVFCANLSSGTNLFSITCGVVAALSFSLYTVLSQKYTKKLGGVVQSTIVFFSGSIVLLIALFVIGIDVSFTLEPINLLTMCYLGFFVTGLGYVCYFKAIEKGGLIMASLAFFIKPILTPYVTFIINGISPDIQVFVAVIFVCIASYYAAYKK